MTWEAVREMGDAGVAFGSHTATVTPRLRLGREYVGPRTGIGVAGSFSPAVFTAELLHLFGGG